MGLIGNHSVIAKLPVTHLGGSTLSGERSNWNQSGQAQGWFSHTYANPAYGMPSTGGPTWVLPRVGGGLGSVGNIEGTGTLAGALAQGINIAAAPAGTGTLTSSLTMVVGLVTSIAGTGSLSASLVGIVQMASALTGTGSVSASLGALAGMVAALTGTGAVSADLRGKLWMESDITPFTELSPENLAASVWNAVAASYNATGSMGEKLNDAGSGSNPWTEVIEGSYTAAELLRIMSAALAGELSGAGTTTIVIKGVDGTTDRITATVSTRGDRTDVTLDAS